MTVSTGKPIWETPAGDLGTIQEGKFFQLALTAYDDSTNDASTLYYTMVAGELPEGIQCTKTGLIEGIPKAVSSLQGVPVEVGQDVTSKFTVRVYTEDANEQPLRVADRTFTLTVTGQDAPEWTTTAGSLGNFVDATEVSIQLAYTDPDPDQTPTVNLLSGELPNGITLSSSGLLSGVLQPVIQLPTDALPGYDRTAYDLYSFDYATRAGSKTYEFTLEITDGYESDVRTFTMFVFARDDLTADSEVFLADGSILTADVGVARTPIVTTPAGDLGTIRHDNFFAYKFDAVDLDGDQLEFVYSGDTVPGLTLNTETGWLYGTIPDRGLTETEYTFEIKARKKDDTTIVSPAKEYTLTIVGDIDTDITWITPTTVGTLKNGEISKLYIEAETSTGLSLEYRLKSGSDSSLPQGLALLSDGTISGRASFQSFTLDGGTTTFDEELSTRLVVDPTTFDREFNFTVEIYNDSDQIQTSKAFKIIIDYEYTVPHETVYIKAMPEQQDRDTLDQLLQNNDIFNNDWLYRPIDPYFGKAESVIYQHAFGIKTGKLEDYVTAMQLNHYKKNLTIGDIKTARALDADDNVVYEVVYADIKGGMINSAGQSVSLAVTLDETITIDNLNEADSSFATVYPNSLLNMQTRIIDHLGQYAEVLPDWMKSKQEDGSILGFTPAWVIAYTIPGRAKQLAYLIDENFSEQLNKIDFTIDRYTIDRRLSTYWDQDNEEWIVGGETIFDKDSVDSSDQTFFDGGGTRFISKIDPYINDDRLDKYVLYPKHNILGNKDYITNG